MASKREDIKNLSKDIRELVSSCSFCWAVESLLMNVSELAAART